MRIVQINCVSSGSTGKIMLNIAETAKKHGNEVYTFSEHRKKAYTSANHYVFGSFFENLFHRGFSVLTGISGRASHIGTARLLNKLDKISPDILHLHNLHGWYINIPMLFEYIRRKKIKTVWTLHDCWAFTAQCSHFTIEKCNKWKTGCYACPRYKIYPYTWVDRTPKMWKLKKAWFSGIEDLTIVTPSVWLADLVKQSFLKDYPVKVINNGIDISIFKPTQSDFRVKYELTDKKIILGVASGWTYRKGLDVFVELFQRLDPNVYQIVLVGTDNKVDEQLPNGIMSIHRTQNQKELAQIYSAADVFVNPTREENYPTVNMEAVACGTPVVTFDTGGSKEIINNRVGAFVPTGDVEQLIAEIQRICYAPCNPIDYEMMATKYDERRRFEEYVSLYHS